MPASDEKLTAKALSGMEKAEVDTLIAMASELMSAKLENGLDITQGAARVMRKAETLFDKYQDEVSRALSDDLRECFEEDAMTQCRTVNASDAMKSLQVMHAHTEAATAKHEIWGEIKGYKPEMAKSARSLYVSECYRAALNLRTGRMGRDEAVRTAVKEMAAQGLHCYSYRTKDGSVVNVPVDVGVRRVILDKAHERLTNQTLRIAKATGTNLVEVDRSGTPRPSHAIWEGQVYRLEGWDSRYENFYDACNVGDPVRGYGGYHCRHHIRIYSEAVGQKYAHDPLEGTGYSHEEAYALSQKQRRYENDIRKLKRQKQVLEAQGLNAHDVNVRIAHRQAAIRKLVKDNPKVLTRERWREQVAAGSAPTFKHPLKNPSPSNEKHALKHMSKTEWTGLLKAVGDLDKAEKLAASIAKAKQPAEKPMQERFDYAFLSLKATDEDREALSKTMRTQTTERSRADLREYSGYAYIDINGYLRSGHSGGKDDVAARLRDEDFENARLEKDIAAWRGIGSVEHALGGIGVTEMGDVNDAIIGRKVPDQGVVSYALSESGAFSKDVTVRAILRKGTRALYIKSISQHPSEDEIVLKPGTAMRIVSYEKKGGKLLLNVEVVSDDED